MTASPTLTQAWPGDRVQIHQIGGGAPRRGRRVAPTLSSSDGATSCTPPAFQHARVRDVEDEPAGALLERLAAAVDLYWIPLGAGNRCVRFNGRVYEALAAAVRGGERRDLFHSALVIELAGDRYTIEVAPSPDAAEVARGVIGTGAVGSRHLGRLRLFRYEVRCWRGGAIPDLDEAVGGPRSLSIDPHVARHVLELTWSVPRPVWGRDELGAGEMWNSNSVVAWLIASAGLAAEDLAPPPGGRAPGWDAGLAVARRRTTDRVSAQAPLEARPAADGVAAGR